MRLFQLTTLTLICCLTLQLFMPLMAEGRDSATCISSLGDEFPSDNPNLPPPVKAFEIEWEGWDCAADLYCLITSLPELTAVVRALRCERSLAGFSSSRQMLSTLHRLHI